MNFPKMFFVYLLALICAINCQTIWIQQSINCSIYEIDEALEIPLPCTKPCKHRFKKIPEKHCQGVDAMMYKETNVIDIRDPKFVSIHLESQVWGAYLRTTLKGDGTGFVYAEIPCSIYFHCLKESKSICYIPPHCMEFPKDDIFTIEYSKYVDSKVNK